MVSYDSLLIRYARVFSGAGIEFILYESYLVSEKHLSNILCSTGAQGTSALSYVRHKICFCDGNIFFPVSERNVVSCME